MKRIYVTTQIQELIHEMGAIGEMHRVRLTLDMVPTSAFDQPCETMLTLV
jgi:hypothetical protein